MKQEKIKTITTYIFKIALSTLFAILVMQQTSTWYNLIKMDFTEYSKYNIATCIIELILYITIITTITINFIIDIKRNTRQ